MRKIHLEPMIKSPAKLKGGDVAAIIIVLTIVLGASAFIAAERVGQYLAYIASEGRV